MSCNEMESNRFEWMALQMVNNGSYLVKHSDDQNRHQIVACQHDDILEKHQFELKQKQLIAVEENRIEWMAIVQVESSSVWKAESNRENLLEVGNPDVTHFRWHSHRIQSRRAFPRWISPERCSPSLSIPAWNQFENRASRSSRSSDQKLTWSMKAVKKRLIVL